MAPTRMWSTKLTSKFIRLYREQTCLWKTNDLNYRNQLWRDQAMKQMVADMAIPDLTVTEVKRRIKTLRATYLIEVKKVLESIQSNDKKTYQPKLAWFNEMHAFIKYGEENMGEKSKLESEGEADETDDDDDDDKKSIYLTDKLEDLDEDESPSTSHETSRKRSRHNNGNTNKKINTLNTINTGGINNKKDEFDIFGTHVASQLRLLSTEQAVIAQNEIQSVITKCRLRDLSAATESSERTFGNNIKIEFSEC